MKNRLKTKNLFAKGIHIEYSLRLGTLRGRRIKLGSFTTSNLYLSPCREALLYLVEGSVVVGTDGPL